VLLGLCDRPATVSEESDHTSDHGLYEVKVMAEFRALKLRSGM
jgi:hypothetical protein